MKTKTRIAISMGTLLVVGMLLLVTRSFSLRLAGATCVAMLLGIGAWHSHVTGEIRTNIGTVNRESSPVAFVIEQVFWAIVSVLFVIGAFGHAFRLLW